MSPVSGWNLPSFWDLPGRLVLCAASLAVVQLACCSSVCSNRALYFSVDGLYVSTYMLHVHSFVISTVGMCCCTCSWHASCACHAVRMQCMFLLASCGHVWLPMLLGSSALHFCPGSPDCGGLGVIAVDDCGAEYCSCVLGRQAGVFVLWGVVSNS
jgi:hypothetical protein